MIEEQELERYRQLKQQRLPFDFYEEEEQKEKKLEEQKKAEVAQKIAKLKNYDHPQNDNEKLLNLQWEYRVNGKEEALGTMFLMAKRIAWKYINTITHSSKKVRHLPSLDREIKAGNAASYLIEQYLTRPGFIITDKVTAYIYLRVVKELFYHTKADEIQDYVDLDKFYKEGTDDEIMEWEAKFV